MMVGLVASLFCAIVCLGLCRSLELGQFADYGGASPSRRLEEKEEIKTRHPVLSDFCASLVEALAADTTSRDINTAVVVIPVRNPSQSLLIEAVKSILNGISEKQLPNRLSLAQIVIADDGSSHAVKEWEAWKEIGAGLVSHVRSASVQGFAKIKNLAADSIASTQSGFHLPQSQLEHTMLVFSPPAIAGPHFLLALAHSLNKYPRSIVYPTEDILLVNADQSMEILPADDNIVAGFDWQFQLAWESRGNTGYELLSPSLPHVFALRYETFKSLGPIDETLLIYNDSSSMENTEYALRAWLCGASVIKQQCSRMAVEYRNVFSTVPLDRQSQRQMDQNVMNLANKWMQTAIRPSTQPMDASVAASLASINTYKEIVFQARFLDRIPYAVETLIDPIKFGPRQSSLFTDAETQLLPLSSDSRLVCTDFKWYLREVYPELETQLAEVTQSYRAYILDHDFLTQQLQSTYAFHYAPSADSSSASNLDVSVADLSNLLLREERFYDHALQTLKIAGNVKHVKQDFVPPPPVSSKVNLEDIISDHSDNVRNNLLCQDVTYQNYCQTRIGAVTNTREFCDAHKAAYIFACPKTCGYCDSGKFCEDFYLRKCVEWQQQGKCGTEDKDYGSINTICRKSCGLCTPDYLKPPSAAPSSSHAQLDTAVLPRSTTPPVAVHLSHPEANHPPVGDEEVNVHIAHDDFLHGMIPDADIARLVSPTACDRVKKTSDGRLLDRIRISTAEHPNVKLFCGIYTIEKAHDNNVKATRNTWAKKCDGFTAFSNKLDKEIPAVNIQHEGEESYNNMWQKSRSIWKYVYAHHFQEYDFFLMGGDDMMYVIENLKDYLASEEIQRAKEQRNGLFLGRVFAPPNQIVFNSGGAGYILDKKALEVLATHLDDPKCFPHQVGFWEDVNVASCLKVSGGITPYDTRDRLERERFHPFNPGNHLDYRIPPKNPDWYPKYSPNLKIGFECCSEESVSFHYLKEKALYDVYNYLYNCPNRG